MAYKLTDKLVLRGGYGIFYPQTGGGTRDGFATTTTWVSTIGGDGINPNPNALLRNPFPQGIAAAHRSPRGLLTQTGDAVNAFSAHHPLGYVQNFWFDFQYEVGKNMVLEVGYTGSQGRKLLFGTGQQANQLDPQYLSLGAAARPAGSNPFFGVIPQRHALAGRTFRVSACCDPSRNSRLSTCRRMRRAPVRPSMRSSYATTGRWRSSLNLLTTYQWSKAIDNASEWQGWEVGDTLRNYYDLRSTAPSARTICRRAL